MATTASPRAAVGYAPTQSAVPSAPSSTRIVTRAVSSPLAAQRTGGGQVYVATAQALTPRAAQVERLVSSPLPCQHSVARARGGYVIHRLVSGGTECLAPPTPMLSTKGEPIAVAGMDTNYDGEADCLYVGVDSNRCGIPDALQASARVNNLLTKGGSFTVPVLHAPLEASMGPIGGDKLTAIVEGGHSPAMDVYLQSCFEWKRSPNNVFRPKPSPRLESRAMSPPVIKRSIPAESRSKSPPVYTHAAPAVPPVHIAQSAVIRPAPKPRIARPVVTKETESCIGHFEREAQKIIDSLEGELLSGLSGTPAEGTDDPQNLSYQESTCSGPAISGGYSSVGTGGLRPSLRGEEVGISKSLKAHAARDYLNSSNEEDRGMEDDIPFLDMADMSEPSTSRPLSQRSKFGRGTADSLDFSPRGSLDLDAEDRAGKIGYTNQFTAQQIWEASLKDGKRLSDTPASYRKWVPPAPAKVRTFAKEPIRSIIDDDLFEYPERERDDDEEYVTRAEVEHQFQNSLRNHRPVKDSRRGTASRKSSTLSNGSQNRGGSASRDSTLSSLTSRGGSLRTGTVLSPRDRSISSGLSVGSRRNNTFNPANISDEDSPNSKARRALERKAFEACRWSN